MIRHAELDLFVDEFYKSKLFDEEIKIKLINKFFIFLDLQIKKFSCEFIKIN
jgi:hypothetical protein